ncbi:PTS sugar transporter subunit IIA [Thalassobacillus sp. CUG 92003]|uniref:PTS sugar transporter subunit IIA n=1 Tax=Thalassobacillus sp. CUG 92003 TaxID=2736641 RepID=UPI001C62E195|nr:PTS sugar transporter subunit IIA [Thalassobacillus sp. CUG 92003]
MSAIYIAESLIMQNMKAESKEDVLNQMAQNLYDQGFVKKSYIQAVIDREHIHATGLPTKGPSVAIPHTDKEHVHRKTLSLGILEQPVDFGVMGEAEATTPVEVVFMLAMDSEDSQLSLLQELMAIFQDEEKLNFFNSEPSKVKLVEALNTYLQGDDS